MLEHGLDGTRARYGGSYLQSQHSESRGKTVDANSRPGL